MIQLSDEWHAERCGRITASRISDVMAKDTTAAYKSYRAELVAERLTGQPEDSYTNPAMERGTELEPVAREAYEADQLVEVVETGLVVHPELPFAGASPDGLVGDNGLVEIKCRKTHLHIDYITNDAIKPTDNRQIQWQLACTGRKWCDFVSYTDRLPEPHNLYVKRIARDDKMIAELTERAKQMNKEIDQIIEQLNYTGQ